PTFTSARIGVTGLVTSSTITFWLAVVELPLPSSKVQVTTVVPCVVIGKTVVVVPFIVPSQSSVVVGVGGVPLHSPTFTSANVGVAGAVLPRNTIWLLAGAVTVPAVSVTTTV